MSDQIHSLLLMDMVNFKNSKKKVLFTLTGMGPVEPPGFSTKTNKEKEEEQRKSLKF